MNEPEQDRLAAHLREAFAPPPAEAFAAMAAQSVPAPRGRRYWPWIVAAAAAAAVVVCMLFFSSPRRFGPEGHDGRQLGAMWAAAFEDAVAQGFGGEGCCQAGIDLPRACGERFHCPLDLAPDSRVSLLGGYSGLPTGGSMTLLAKAGGAPMCICVVPAKCDPSVQLPHGCKLQLARRELGDLVLYALSKTSTGRALESFVLPKP